MNKKQSRRASFRGKEYISLTAAAARLGVSPSLIYQWAEKKIAGNGTPFRTIRDTFTKQKLVSEECIEDLLANRFEEDLLSRASSEQSDLARLAQALNQAPKEKPPEDPQPQLSITNDLRKGD